MLQYPVDEAVTACGGTTAPQLRHDGETTDLRTHLTTKTQECPELRRQLEAAATVITTLHHENIALRAQLNRQGTVVPLDIRHALAEPEPVP